MAESNGHTAPRYVAPMLRAFAAMTSRLGLSYRLGSTHDGARQIEEVLGYKDTLTYRDFKRAYIRYDLAKRLVQTLPQATWSQLPLVHEDAQADTTTAFEEAWTTLADRLHLLQAITQLDLLAQLGHYSTLLLGLRGQANLTLPASPVRTPEDVLFVQPYSEELMTVETFGNDASQTDYGKPTVYRLFGGTSEDTTDLTLRRPPRSGVLVHASRVIHLPGTDGLDDPDIYGVPMLEAVYNKLVDLLKVVGGSAEMYWRDAKRRIALEVQEGYQLSPEDADHLEEEAAEYQHGLRDFLRLMGVQAKDLSGTVASPKEHFDVLIQTIAGTCRIPARILLGSERGQLASSQDQDEYLRQIGQRQQTYAEPRLLRPLIDRLLLLRALPQPRQPYTVEWPNLWALSELQQADVISKRASAFQATMSGIASYTGPGMAETLITREEARALMGPIWQGTELELPAELPSEIEALLVEPVQPALLPPGQTPPGDATTTPPADDTAPGA